MILFPAIDLKHGQCVRLKCGNINAATIFNDDPAAQARNFEDQGFSWLHVVDLDGAFAGKAINSHAIDAILAATSNPVQLGGGIRTLHQIESWLEKGVRRVILGTSAAQNPELVKQACKMFPGQIAVGIDTRGKHVAVEGWGETLALTAGDLARQFEDAGVAAIIFTDIERDGILKGLNFTATIALAETVSIPVIASGGLASLDDIRELMRPPCAKLEGAITGRALYDGRLDPKAALALITEGTQ